MLIQKSRYIVLLICSFCLSSFLEAQTVPQGINYQGLLNDALGNPVSNQLISLKIDIHSVSISGSIVWEETHSVSTDQFGLFHIIIGQGVSTGSGSAASFSAIHWGAAGHFLQIGVDATGGTSYVNIESAQLNAVPYALYSLKADSLANPISINDLTDVDTIGVSVGKTLKWNGINWVPANDNNSDTALYAYNSGHSTIADSAVYAIHSSSSDSSLFSNNSNNANSSNTSINSNQSIHSNHSDTATYSLNCIGTTNYWNLTGNSGIGASNFLGSINSADLIFKTNNIEQMRLTAAGKLGLGIAIPLASFHIVGNNGIIEQGTFGSGTALALGTGTRMMWYPKKAAFRVGFVNGNRWDDVNIGAYSFATGYDCVAQGIGAVSMGQTCTASDSCGVAIGWSVTTTGKYAVGLGNYAHAYGYGAVAIGRSNTASGYTSVAIGYHNTATGNYSLSMGNYSQATGAYSVALGSYSNTNGMTGSFVYSDLSNQAFPPLASANNQFMVKAAGGVIFYSNSTMTSGVSLAAGSGSWSTLSDKNKKENFRKENGEEMMKKIMGLEITSWNYKTQSRSIRHIGPMAQDFYAQFLFGESDTTISTVDIEGLNLFAIQTLAKRTEELKKALNEVDELKAQLQKLEKQKNSLECRLDKIEKAIGEENKSAPSLNLQTINKNSVKSSGLLGHKE